MPPAETVLCLLPSLTALGGGIELYLRQFLEALAADRPAARFSLVLGREAALGRPELLSEELRARVTVRGAGDGHGRIARVATFLGHAAAAALRERPSLVVCGHVNYAAAAAAAASASGARLVMLTYGVEAWQLDSPMVRRALCRADRIVAISSFTAAQLMRVLPIDADRIAVLPNAVDVARFVPGPVSAAVQAKLSTLERPRLLTVSRLDAAERYKGIEVVIEALVRRPALAGSYLVVGDGTDRARLETLARDARAPVTFFGRASDEELPDLYRACDLFVMPSRNEGFGYVFIEALACGIPVVAGGVDGSVDALAGGALGVLVNPLDPDSVADGIAAQLEGRTPPALRDPAGLHAEVTRRFSHAAFNSRVAAAIGS